MAQQFKSDAAQKKEMRVLEHFKWKERYNRFKRKEKFGEKRKSPFGEEEEKPEIDWYEEDEDKKPDLLAQVRAVCAEKKLKAEKDKAQADQEVMKIGCRADTTVRLLKKYGVYDQVQKVVVGLETYPNHTCWTLGPSEKLKLWVSHAWAEPTEVAEVTVGKHDIILRRGTIQQCVQLLVELLKAPESQ